MTTDTVITDTVSTALVAFTVLLLVLVPRAVHGRRQVARRLDLLLGRCDPHVDPHVEPHAEPHAEPHV